MKKFLIVLFLIAVLFLDFAALEDISKGNEPEYITEYLILIVSGVIFIGLGVIIYKNRRKIQSLGK